MKFRIRAISPPAKVTVSGETLVCTRSAVEAFGLTPEALDQLATFKGDVTIGPASMGLVVRSAVKSLKSPRSLARDRRSRA